MVRSQARSRAGPPAVLGAEAEQVAGPVGAVERGESGQVLDLIRRIRDRGLPVILISHNMPHVFEVADRIHIQRLGRRVALVTPNQHSMPEVVAIMTGAMPGDEQTAPADQVPRPV